MKFQLYQFSVGRIRQIAHYRSKNIYAQCPKSRRDCPPNSKWKVLQKYETIITNFIRGEHTPHTDDEAAKLKASIVSQDVIFPPKFTMDFVYKELQLFGQP